MARVKTKDDNLGDLAGKLTTGFNAVTLRTLGRQYEASGPNASKVLTDFFLAASRLQRTETEFNRKARPKSASEPHDLKANLRDDLTAARNFETAKQSLLAVNPDVGAKIVSVVERNLVSSTKPVSKPAAKRSFTPAASAPAV